MLPRFPYHFGYFFFFSTPLEHARDSDEKKKVKSQVSDGRYAMHKTRWKEKRFQKFLLNQSCLAEKKKEPLVRVVELGFQSKKGRERVKDNGVRV